MPNRIKFEIINGRGEIYNVEIIGDCLYLYSQTEGYIGMLTPTELYEVVKERRSYTNRK